MDCDIEIYTHVIRYIIINVYKKTIYHQIPERLVHIGVTN